MISLLYLFISFIILSICGLIYFFIKWCELTMDRNRNLLNDKEFTEKYIRK